MRLQFSVLVFELVCSPWDSSSRLAWLYANYCTGALRHFSRSLELCVIYAAPSLPPPLFSTFVYHTGDIHVCRGTEIIVPNFQRNPNLFVCCALRAGEVFNKNSGRYIRRENTSQRGTLRGSFSGLIPSCLMNLSLERFL